MKKFILVSLCLFSQVSVALDAGVVSRVDAGVAAGVDAGVSSDAGVDGGVLIEMTALSIVGVSESVDAGVSLSATAPIVPSMEDPLSSAKGLYHAITTKNGWLIAMFLLFFLVGGLRIVGKRVHAMIPDDTTHVLLRPIEKALYFIFDTKIGGWVLNWLSAIGGCLASAHMAGHPVDGEAWKVAFLASTGGTALIELKDDVMAWWDKKNAEKAAAKAAKVVETPVPLHAVDSAPPPPAIPPVDSGKS